MSTKCRYQPHLVDIEQPASPFRNRPMSIPPPRPQSPLTSARAGIHPPTTTAHLVLPPADPIDVDFVIHSIPHDALLVDKPFGHGKSLWRLSFWSGSGRGSILINDSSLVHMAVWISTQALLMVCVFWKKKNKIQMVLKARALNEAANYFLSAMWNYMLRVMTRLILLAAQF